MDFMTTKRISIQSKEGALLISVISTGLSLLPTLYVTVISNSLVLVGDLLRCVFEFVAVLLSWMVIRRVSRGDETFYDYGFGKLEQLGSLVVAFAMLGASAIVGFTASQRLLSPTPLENGMLGFILGVLSVLGNGAVTLYNRHLAAKDPSPILESQWKLFRAKAVASFVVVVSLGLGLSIPGSPVSLYADSIGSIVLSAFLLYSAYGLFSSSMSDLLDRSIEEALRLRLFRVLIEHESRYQGFHGIRARRVGRRIFVDVFLEFSEEMKLRDVGKEISIISETLTKVIPGSELSVIPVIPTLSP